MVQKAVSLRWIAVTIFVLTSVLNYLDRFVLATMVEIWRARPDFPISYEDYGTSQAVFGICYAISAPFMGIFLDRVGLNLGMCISVGLWSLVSMSHGLIHNVGELFGARAALGIVEASGISGAGKVGGMYLKPHERAMGAAMSQLGLSLGAGVAPVFTIYFAENYGWRWAFLAAGVLGLLWIPLWLATSKAIPAPFEPTRAAVRNAPNLLRDHRIWALMAANALSMTFYSLWTNWAPTYLVRVHHLTPKTASQYSWVVPICGYFGALLGGSISWRLIQKNRMEPVEARKRVCFFCAVILCFSAFIPLLPTPLLATIGMSLSYFWISAWSTNLYTIPVDLYGAAQAASGVSALVFAYGAMTAIVSKPLGRVIGQVGFQPILLTFAFLPLIAYLIIRYAVRASRSAAVPA